MRGRSFLLLGVCIASCGGGAERGFDSDAAAPSSLLGDGGAPCDGLACQQVDCAAMGLPDTTISGIVYDPAGRLPLYNVFVYVPNAPLDPIEPGHPTCSPCQARASGRPLVSSTTDVVGRFTLAHAPSGSPIPLVMQVGKWRRAVTLPRVQACADNVIDDHDLTRLPSKSIEGDMPRIALTTGCDAAECFLRTIGIDDSEFTGVDRDGRVHVYGGHYDQGTVVQGAGDAYDLWASSARLAFYDIVFGACECQPYPRDTEGPAYQAMRQYLDAGGRLYTTHFHYNWFAPPGGPNDFQGLAQWQPQAGVDTSFFVDTSFPKGKAFADWLRDNHLSSDYARLDLTDTRASVGAVTGATRWIYAAQSPTDATYETKYLTFNTPVGAPATQQCGRATFSDVHLSGVSLAPGPFPTECGKRVGEHGVDERALEFLFFDLSSCVQDDGQDPPAPVAR